jgi:hypothetical protein
MWLQADSSDSDDASRPAVEPPTAAPAVSTFYFHSPLLQGPLCLRQPDVSGAIGFKLYPAALLMCGLVEAGLALEAAEGGSAEGPGASTTASASASASSGGVLTMDAAARRVRALVPDLSWRRAAVVEVGAGVCALPSMLLARVGAACLPTVRTVTSLPSPLPSPACTQPLLWAPTPAP